jgi:hypothetical protein
MQEDHGGSLRGSLSNSFPLSLTNNLNLIINTSRFADVLDFGPRGMSFILELGNPFVLKRARCNSHTPVVVQFCHPLSSHRISITASESIEHEPWLISFCFQDPTGHRICASRALFLGDAYSVSG